MWSLQLEKAGIFQPKVLWTENADLEEMKDLMNSRGQDRAA